MDETDDDEGPARWSKYEVMEGWKGRLRMCWSGRLGVDEGRIGGIFSFLFFLLSLSFNWLTILGGVVEGSCLKEALMGVPVDGLGWTGFLVL